MKVSIITPSFRNSDWLKLCVASVADQQNANIEHIVQDSCSDDGTNDWLPQDKRVKAHIEKDSGMYDAVNRGFGKATGDILAYLNCDEQYLPGAIQKVSDFFENNPRTDVLIADTVVVDDRGEFICCRKCLKPWDNFIWVHNPTITSSIFLHRRVLDYHSLYFDTKWRDLGDIFWMIKAVNSRLTFATMRTYTSTFTDTGNNMNLKPNAQRERQQKIDMMPLWINRVKGLLFRTHQMRQLLAGTYHQSPFSYSIYTHSSISKRRRFEVTKPTCIWRNRHAVMNVPSTKENLAAA